MCTRSCMYISATRLARRHWRSMGARTESEARSFYVARLRRRMGVAAVREFARRRLRRMPYVGVPRAVVEQRMQLGAGTARPRAQTLRPAARRNALFRYVSLRGIVTTCNLGYHSMQNLMVIP